MKKIKFVLQGWRGSNKLLPCKSKLRLEPRFGARIVITWTSRWFGAIVRLILENLGKGKRNGMSTKLPFLAKKTQLPFYKNIRPF